MSDSEPIWSNKHYKGAYHEEPALRVFVALGLPELSLPTPIALLARALPPTATMLGGQLVGALTKSPFNDIDIWCLKGDGSPYEDTVAAVEKALLHEVFSPGNYSKSVSAGMTTVFSSTTMPPVAVHGHVFEDIGGLLDCVDFTINQIATVGLATFVCGRTTIDDLKHRRLRYAQPPDAKTPLIKELRDSRFRRYVSRGFLPDPSVADMVRGYSPLLANQLQAQAALNAAADLSPKAIFEEHPELKPK